MIGERLKNLLSQFSFLDIHASANQCARETRGKAEACELVHIDMVYFENRGAEWRLEAIKSCRECVQSAITFTRMFSFELQQ